MTAAQQPKEYICNDDDLGCLYDYMMAAMAGNDISELPRLWNQEIGVIKSRPHTSTQTKCSCDGCRKELEHLDCPTPGNCDQMKCVLCCEGSDFPTLPEEIKKYEADAVRQAREQVLDVMRSLDACGCPHVMCHSGDGHDGLNCRDCVIKFIEESLRIQQQAGEHP